MRVILQILPTSLPNYVYNNNNNNNNTLLHIIELVKTKVINWLDDYSNWLDQSPWAKKTLSSHVHVANN